MLHTGSWVGLHAYDDTPNLRAIAAYLGIPLSENPTEEEIQEQLFGKLGKGKVYGDNAERLADTLGTSLEGNLDDEFLDLLEGSGLLNELPVRSVHGQDDPAGPVHVIIAGGTVNWMRRRVRLLSNLRDCGVVRVAEVIPIAGPRLCDTATEKDLPFVRGLMEGEDDYPTESQVLYAMLQQCGFAQSMRWDRDNDPNFSPDLDVNVTAFAQSYARLRRLDILLITNAAALNQALQVRRLVRGVYPDFDRPDDPQFFFAQDGFRLARTPDQAKNTVRYQRPRTFLSCFPRLTHELYLLSQSG